MKKLMFIAGVDWHFISHRLPIALAAIENGYEVHLASAMTGKEEELKSHGIKTHALALNRGSMNPITEARLFLSILLLYFKIKPDIVHLVTIKPVLYGAIAARIAGVKAVVAAVPGLGFIFMSEGIKAKIRLFLVAILYKMALGHKNIRVIFQNPDDRTSILKITNIDERKTELIRGAGVDLAKYPLTPLPEGKPVVMLAARLLRDKGVYEFVEAARILKQKAVNASFCLVGAIDAENPTSLRNSDIEQLKNDEIVEILGYKSEIAETLGKANIIVLPSYREGLPKILIEAAACGRAVVTTDVPGCKDAITPNETGVLVPAKDATSLAAAIESLLLNVPRLKSMGEAGRVLAEREFDIKNVVAKHLQIYNSLL